MKPYLDDIEGFDDGGGIFDPPVVYDEPIYPGDPVGPIGPNMQPIDPPIQPIDPVSPVGTIGPGTSGTPVVNTPPKTQVPGQTAGQPAPGKTTIAGVEVDDSTLLVGAAILVAILILK